jgi:phosphatidylglycerol---prolipoprotein diacylglyceryl transferase
VIATGIFLRWYGLPLLATLDAWSPCATLVWCFLAAGHFFEGSDAGLPTKMPWGFAIPPDKTTLHPVALYASVAAGLLTLGLLVFLVRRVRSGYRSGSRSGDAFVLALGGSGAIQFLLTFFRQPYPYTGSFGSFLDPVQWIALVMIVVAGFVFLLQPGRTVSHAI